MHRYKETIFQFLYVEILEEAKFKCGQTEINLNEKKKKKKKPTLNSINLVVFTSILCGCKLYE